MRITCVISSAGTSSVLPILNRCIESLRRAKTKKTHVCIVVTTNNPNHTITNRFINVLCVSPPSAGFVEINNLAVLRTAQKTSDYYLIINDDAWIEKDFFKQLSFSLQKNQNNKDIIVPIIYEKKTKRLDSFGVEYFPTGYPKNACSKKIDTSLASMSCLLIKTRFIKKMIASYGYFLNPQLTWYLEDVDFSIRALALGGTIYKDDSLVAHHLQTFTWGKKSYRVIYYSFRNLLWVILLTWPKQTIIKNCLHIVWWQALVCWYCLIKYTPFLYPKMVLHTLQQSRSLLRERKHILSCYTHPEIFTSLFSSLKMRHKRLTF